MSRRPIVLLTDFGYRDPYVGVMKGVIKTINPYAEIIDLTHNIRRQDVLEAAVVLLVSAKYFPVDTIFTCVVDPGVGSGRRAILIKTRNYYLVGPDNGCLSLLAKKDDIVNVYDVSDSEFTLKDKSWTFHGRDLFAPISAYLSLGYPPERLGVEVSKDSIKYIELEDPRILDDGLEARVLYIDVFGNIMLNIEEKTVESLGIGFGEELTITIGEKTIDCRFVKTFSQVREKDFACYINSWGYFEIAIYMGNASQELGVSPGDTVLIKRKT